MESGPGTFQEMLPMLRCTDRKYNFSCVCQIWLEIVICVSCKFLVKLISVETVDTNSGKRVGRWTGVRMEGRHIGSVSDKCSYSKGIQVATESQ
jgi:hypothetical protein